MEVIAKQAGQQLLEDNCEEKCSPALSSCGAASIAGDSSLLLEMRGRVPDLHGELQVEAAEIRSYWRLSEEQFYKLQCNIY